MKKITSLLLTLAMLASVFVAMPVSASSDVWGDAEVATAFAGGTGTADDPFLISNAAQLRYMNDLVNSGKTYQDAEGATKNYYEASYKLTADIDYENGEWIPLGQALPLSYDPTQSYSKRVTRKNGFEGTFDGDGHVIKNIKITHTSEESATVPHSEYLGFFGYCKDAEISNLGIDNIDIQYYNYEYVYNTYDSNGTTKNAVERAQYIGGFAGYIANTTITGCYVTNSVVMNTNSGINDTAHAAFLGAFNQYNTVNNCYAYNVTMRGGLTSTQSGFFGTCTSSNNSLSNCYAAEIKHGEGSVHPTTFGFGSKRKDDGTGITSATNCYSTLGDAQGAGVNYGARGRAYDPTHSVGEPSMTAEALVEAMLATGVYAQDPAINNGYPHLKSAFDGTPAERFEYGSGSEDDPYLIRTPGELLLASNMVNEGTSKSDWFKLANDIDYGNQPWIPIGYSNANGTADFSGGFDGDGHVVRNLTLAEGQFHYAGFFGQLTGATIKNLGIENFQLIRSNVADSYIRVVGGFAGQIRSTDAVGMERGTTITNCYIKDSSVQQQRNYSSSSSGLYTDSNLGGFIGQADIRSYTSEIKNCYVENVSLYTCYQGEPAAFIGGVTVVQKPALAQDFKLTNCYAANITNLRSGIVTQFAFGHIGDSQVNAENIVLDKCYTTFSTVEGTDTNATKLEKTTYFDATVTTPAAITAAFAGVDGWQDGALINDGLPALAWEETPAAPDYMIVSVANEIKKQNIDENNVCTLTTENKITVNLRRTPGVTGVANLYVAGYDIDDRLTGAQCAQVDKDDFSFTADIDAENAVTIKVFLWDDDQMYLLSPYVAEATTYDQFNEIWAPEGSEVETPVKKTKLVLMGDSIMDNSWNGSSYSWRKYGWEGYIEPFIDTDNMAVVKHGHSGQTVKMFMDGRSTYHTCSWETIKRQFGKGDYVVLALGSNDNACIERYNEGNYENEVGEITEDGEQRAYFSVDWYKEQYRKIINETRAKGATIIIMTPKVNSGCYVSETGKFDPELQTPIARNAVLELAKEMDVACIDMATVYGGALNKMIDNKEYTGEEMLIQKSGSTVTGPGVIFVDSTHLTEFGAQLFAELFAKEVEKMTTGLEEFVVIPTE